MDFFDYVKSNKLVILILSLSLNLILIIVGVILYINLYNKECYCEKSTEYVAAETDTTEEIFVEVKGAVKNPGVYNVKSNCIINDIINLADGFTKNAYTKNINLSKKVSNELVIYVYTESEYKKLKKKTDTKKEVIVQPECYTSTHIIDNCTGNGSSEIIVSDNDTIFDNNVEENNTEESNKVNINTAGVTELITLSGIGESRANDIIEYRTQNGNFKSIEDIKNVSGIGDSLFEKIKENINEFGKEKCNS